MSNTAQVPTKSGLSSYNGKIIVLPCNPEWGPDYPYEQALPPLSDLSFKLERKLKSDLPVGVHKDFENEYAKIVEETVLEVTLIKILNKQLCELRGKQFQYVDLRFEDALNSYMVSQWMDWKPQEPAEKAAKEFLATVLSTSRYPLSIKLPDDWNYSGPVEDPLCVEYHYAFRAAILLEKYSRFLRK
jgi:hypothetical protein